MTSILVVYHSQGGNNAKMALAVAEGVNAIEGAQAVLRDAFEASLDDLLGSDGLIVGTPEYFGYMSGALKDFFDRTYEHARGNVFRKPYGVFINAGNDGTGALQSIERICIGYQFKKVHEPVIARGEITRRILEACTEMGMTIAAGCAAGIY